MLIAFDPDNKLHQELFDNFKKDLLSDIYNKDHLFCRYEDYIDEMNIIMRDLAVEELGCDSDINEFDSYWTTAIYNNQPITFGIIIGIEYIDHFTEINEIEFIKAEGEILIEDNKLAIWNIDPCSLNYSSRQEFETARHSY